MEMSIETELVRQLCACPHVSVHAQLCGARSRVGQSIKTLDGLQLARMLHEPQAADRLAAPARRRCGQGKQTDSKRSHRAPAVDRSVRSQFIRDVSQVWAVGLCAVEYRKWVAWVIHAL